MDSFCKIKMPSTHILSMLYIILISGFKLGLAAPTDEIKGEQMLLNTMEKYFLMARAKCREHFKVWESNLENGAFKLPHKNHK